MSVLGRQAVWRAWRTSILHRVLLLVVRCFAMASDDERRGVVGRVDNASREDGARLDEPLEASLFASAAGG